MAVMLEELRRVPQEPAYVVTGLTGLELWGSSQDSMPWKIDLSMTSTRAASEVSSDVSAETAVPTEGSHGHPELCHRPCLYFARGNCQSGYECRYCHLSHEERPIVLDKSQREAARLLSKAQMLSLLVPHLSRVAEEKGLTDKVTEILLFASQQLIDAGSPEPATAKLERKLRKALRKMSFSGLLGLLRQTLSEGEAACLSKAVEVARVALTGTPSQKRSFWL
ncbi:nipblb [Symbiodinium natans]|uniref:Nipblb protein n=1 Tax=Symbiodinium natans TaxID=878477 RepID=A0A812RHB3_9DINO|nr:nipblb [Symbiodinium natans]